MSSHTLSQAGLKHKASFLPQHPKCWDYRQESPHIVPSVLLEWQVKLKCILSFIFFFFTVGEEVSPQWELVPFTRQNIWVPLCLLLIFKMHLLIYYLVCGHPLGALPEAGSLVPPSHTPGWLWTPAAVTLHLIGLQMHATGARDLNSRPHTCVGSAERLSSHSSQIKGLSHYVCRCDLVMERIHKALSWTLSTDKNKE